MSSCVSEATIDEDTTEAIEAEQPHTQDEADVGGWSPMVTLRTDCIPRKMETLWLRSYLTKSQRLRG